MQINKPTNKSPLSYGALLTLILIITVATLLWHVLENAHSIQEKIHQAKPWLGLWRLCLFALLIGFWPKLIQKNSKVFPLEQSPSNQTQSTSLANRRVADHY